MFPNVWVFPDGSVGEKTITTKTQPANVGHAGDVGSNLGLGGSSAGGNDNTL